MANVFTFGCGLMYISEMLDSPIVFLHGFMGHPDQAATIVRATRRSYRGVRLPGHGVPFVRVANFETTLDMIAGDIAALGTAVHLLGYSMGARVALGLLCRHGHLIDRATLIAAHPGLGSTTERQSRGQLEQRWIDKLAGKGLSAFVADWERMPLFASQDGLSPQQHAEQRSLRLAHDAHGLIHAIETLGLSRMPNWQPELPTISQPVTLMVGANDTKFVELAEGMAQDLPRAKVSIVPDCGHNVLLECEQAVTAELREGHEKPELREGHEKLL